MIVYGSRMYFKKNVVKSYGECEHCGDFGKMTSYQARKFGHIYFIPLIPMGKSSQILQECKGCSMGAQIPLDQLDSAVDSVADQFKSLIVSATEGETEIEVEPGYPKINIGAMIASIMGQLYCLKEIESPDSISDVLMASNMSYENELVLAKWNELNGDLDKTSAHYEAAHRLQPEAPLPIYHKAVTEFRSGRIDAAEEGYKKYLQLEPEDVVAHGELAGIYQKQKRFDQVVKSYDEVFRINPENLSNKHLKKIYKKACKKSGVQGAFLAQM